MPTYQYKCENGHAFEEFQSMADLPIETCPNCGARAERQISGGSGLIFKGSGFYLTDYVRNSGKPGSGSSGGSETPPAKSTAESPATKTDTKDASK